MSTTRRGIGLHGSFIVSIFAATHLYLGTPLAHSKERRIETKRRLTTGLILAMVALLSISVSATTALAWSQSIHAYVAEKCLELDYRYVASYNARMGSIVPDFFWYLRDFDLIDQGTADKIHGDTEELVPGTTYFYDIAFGNLKWWQYGLAYFTEGIKTHVYADIKAHNPADGYLESQGGWVDILDDKTESTEDRASLHLALEFAVDSLLVHRDGLQVGDLLISYWQAYFLEKSVKEAFAEIGVIPDFNIRLKFKKYLALTRALEKVAYLYAPYLIRGEVDEEFLSRAASSELLEAMRELPSDGLWNYLNLLAILLNYPGEIYETLNEGEMNWESLFDEDFCSSLFWP